MDNTEINQELNKHLKNASPVNYCESIDLCLEKTKKFNANEKKDFVEHLVRIVFRNHGAAASCVFANAEEWAEALLCLLKKVDPYTLNNKKK